MIGKIFDELPVPLATRLMKVTKTISVALMCVTHCSCSHSTRIAYEDDKVKVLHKDTVNYLNVHASSEEMWLVAFGKTYKDVRGQAPFYLEIPSKGLILFVTGGYENGRAVVHVLNYRTGKEVHFPAHDAGIGKNIISEAKANEQRFENVESVEGEKVVISAGFGDRRYRYYLDLQKPEFEKVEGVEPDPLHKDRTNSFVWPHGKIPTN